MANYYQGQASAPLPPKGHGSSAPLPPQDSITYGYPVTQFPPRNSGAYPVNPVTQFPPRNSGAYPVNPLTQFPPRNPGAWTTGLCGCCENCSVCCYAYWCPCVLVGRYANILDQGATSTFVGGAIYFLVAYLTGCGFLYSCLYRTKLRQKYGLPEEPCNDVCTDCCCNCCSISQVYRELLNRNINPADGYDMVRAVYEHPPPVQEMHKM